MFEKVKLNEEPPMDLLLLADPSYQRVMEHLKSGICMVYKEDNCIVGSYILVMLDSERIELVNIAVKASKQGVGIGKKLLDHAIAYATENQFKEMIVGTGNSSINQIAFYQKAGFRLIDVIFDFFIQDNEAPIYENGVWCRDMLRFKKQL
ncbi:N-acetyltransferase [Staphylococcus hyicus]|uniref:GNAT family N-acetyltransferase n=2 Tax=Staphylococcus hyicus TaxID=1284 RepID=A0ACD5FL12_STAHY|nr:GNAT family N-acetyltransferase [Staphylococcus hyicus]MCQ9290287.1 GNAT family N-acetyltransferase [Staphylococcus hyicus]MCQ9305529.1 GNAT family N-acetyltransferase [Staphylococcus hyicus]MCQ9307941.1 GNAT family N-acetyltransferase [Staphylococcus hyicus]MCQ9310363.1 GNAT family N-acetyltransferase [Staphylococcus hyicus]MDP4460380.1 GNAT family N-acetyltransferase [Staphylococcus hyicus]